MYKIGLFGVGHLGKIHLKCIQLAKAHYEMVGFYDPDQAVAQKVAEENGLKAFADPDELIDAVDVVDIVTPTTTHFELAGKCIRQGKHLFIEKPLAHTVDEGRELLSLAREYGVKVQVGHVERFNPALLALGDMPIDPMFVEAHRLATFNPRGTDVSVVLDLMIHDIDILLSMVNAPVRKISASGVAVVSETPDIANARLEFENGCVANLTASRISLKQMRKIRLFQRDAYISLDLLTKEAQVVRLYDDQAAHIPEDNLMTLDTASGKKHIHINMPDIEPVNAIKLELESLAESIRLDHRPKVDIADGFQALEVANQIAQEIEQRVQDLLK